MIAIEYKSEKRESRYVLDYKFRSSGMHCQEFCLLIFQNSHRYPYTSETAQSIISMPSHYTISHSTERLVFLPCFSSAKSKSEHLVEGGGDSVVSHLQKFNFYFFKKCTLLIFCCCSYSINYNQKSNVLLKMEKWKADVKSQFIMAICIYQNNNFM